MGPARFSLPVTLAGEAVKKRCPWMLLKQRSGGERTQEAEFRRFLGLWLLIHYFVSRLHGVGSPNLPRLHFTPQSNGIELYMLFLWLFVSNVSGTQFYLKLLLKICLVPKHINSIKTSPA